MISLLICSIQPLLLEKVKANINKTIGCECEIISFDNRETKKGICEVYNQLAAQAKYEILCFVHEDVIFATVSWGQILYNILREDESIGVIGVAGCKYKSVKYSGWYTGVKELDCANIKHRNAKSSEHHIHLQSNINSKLEEVVCLDGVFICCRKKVWELVKYDELNLKGFHFYDIDFTARASKNFKVVVSYLIDITHFTQGGDFGNKWVETAFNYHSFSRSNLPITKLVNTSKKLELLITGTYLDVLKNSSISFANKLKWIAFQRLYLHPGLFYSIIKFLTYRPLRLKHVHNLFKSK